MWSLIVGALAPPLVAVIQQPRWADWQRTLATVALCIVAGLGTCWFTGEFTSRDIISSCLVVIVAALATYRSLWKSARVAPLVERATSSRASRRVD